MSSTANTNTARGQWSEDEHERFLEGLAMFPDGPWKAVADIVGTRTVRQVQTHAQKYQERAARRLRALRQDQERLVQPDAMIEKEMEEICKKLQRNRVLLSPRSAQLQQRSMEQLGLALSPTNDGALATSHLFRQSSVPSVDECLDFLIEALSNADEAA